MPGSIALPRFDSRTLNVILSTMKLWVQIWSNYKMFWFKFVWWNGKSLILTSFSKKEVLKVSICERKQNFIANTPVAGRVCQLLLIWKLNLNQRERERVEEKREKGRKGEREKGRKGEREKGRKGEREKGR